VRFLLLIAALLVAAIVIWVATGNRAVDLRLHGTGSHVSHPVPLPQTQVSLPSSSP